MIGAVVAGFFAGIVSGMGIGGGTVLIPALLWLYDLEQQTLQGINLLYFVPTALIAIYTHLRQKTIAVKIAKPLIFTGLLGAAAGAFLAVYLDGTLLRKLFGGFLCLMGLREIFVAGRKKPANGQTKNPPAAGKQEPYGTK